MGQVEEWSCRFSSTGSLDSAWILNTGNIVTWSAQQFVVATPRIQVAGVLMEAPTNLHVLSE